MGIFHTSLDLSAITVKEIQKDKLGVRLYVYVEKQTRGLSLEVANKVKQKTK